MIVLYIMSNGTPEENLKQIFRVFDINNDGTITLKVNWIYKRRSEKKFLILPWRNSKK